MATPYDAPTGRPHTATKHDHPVDDELRGPAQALLESGSRRRLVQLLAEGTSTLDVGSAL